ncbi:hypothetical protein QRO11_09480 [Paracidovorax citrulli]|uniref:hypothetical protein n=1 Tax=Paracidovorax citrulli TaxID=80869 RepID=UPI001D181EFD|nr:hypothetical protein [Paracidovorax citrulli]UEG48482.1 hypothetical protein LKW27_09245 [Paracidovorax citrulli]WIY37034.1 hypothetical protein QRO11_09480 [Paracidovorax citrulli]
MAVPRTKHGELSMQSERHYLFSSNERLLQRDRPVSGPVLRNLIAAGHIASGVVDERSTEDVHPDDLRGFAQCHFFAGIGVWSLALRRASWPDDRPVWTGSVLTNL